MKTAIVCDIGTNWTSLDDIKMSIDFIRSKGCLSKLQLWTTNKFVHKEHPNYETYYKNEIQDRWVKSIKADDVFYTPFTLDKVDFLERHIKPKYYKIASPDAVYEPLVRRVAKCNTQTFMSVGGCNLNEIRQATNWFKESTRDFFNLTLLDAVCNYPVKQANLGWFRDRVIGSRLLPWGYSYQGLSTLVPALSVALGATVVEVHFKLGGIMNTPDAGHSFEPSGLEQVIENIKIAEDNLGNFEKPLEEEKENLSKARRKGDGKR